MKHSIALISNLSLTVGRKVQRKYHIAYLIIFKKIHVSLSIHCIISSLLFIGCIVLYTDRITRLICNNARNGDVFFLSLIAIHEDYCRNNMLIHHAASNFNTHFIVDIITYPCQYMLVKGDPWYEAKVHEKLWTVRLVLVKWKWNILSKADYFYPLFFYCRTICFVSTWKTT